MVAHLGVSEADDFSLDLLLSCGLRLTAFADVASSFLAPCQFGYFALGIIAYRLCRLLRARRADAELATKLVSSNLRRHWRQFPAWILEAASAAPDMLLKRLASGFVLSQRLRADAAVETRKLLADFGECWPLRRQFFPHPSSSSAIVAGLAWQAHS